MNNDFKEINNQNNEYLDKIILKYNYFTLSRFHFI